MRIRGAEWEKSGRYYILTDRHGFVPDIDGMPVIVPISGVELAALYVGKRSSAGEQQSAALTSIGIALGMDGLPGDGWAKLALSVALTGVAPDFIRALPPDRKQQLMDMIMRASMGNTAIPFDPGAVIPEDKDLDNIARQLFVSNDKYQIMLDGLLGEHSRPAMHRRHMRKMENKGLDTIVKYKEEVKKSKAAWKENKLYYREALDEHWSPDWSLEHALKMAERYDRNVALLDAYKKSFPDERNALKDFGERTKRLGLGDGMPMVESLTGLAASLAVGGAIGLVAKGMRALAAIGSTVTSYVVSGVTKEEITKPYQREKRGKEMEKDIFNK